MIAHRVMSISAGVIAGLFVFWARKRSERE